ncbi:MAG: MarR family transcriptional regulator [Candidatus Tectomicrobia bacterium]|nr:MarR family transcriptional regulator [Candidatus Tectomicrobia bacterium]
MKAQAATAITPERCAQDVMETIPLVMRFIRTEMRSRRAPSLSVPQFRVLTFLSRRPGAPLTRVTEHLGVSRSTASALVDRLVRRQLVSRAEDPQERRCVMLTLTPTGAQHLQQAREATCARLANVLAGLPPADLLHVADGLTRLGAAFEESSASPRR